MHWGPPPVALERLGSALSSPASAASVSGYAPNEGLPALRAALRKKLADKNGLQNVSAWGCGACVCNGVL